MCVCVRESEREKEREGERERQRERERERGRKAWVALLPFRSFSSGILARAAGVSGCSGSPYRLWEGGGCYSCSLKDTLSPSLSHTYPLAHTHTLTHVNSLTHPLSLAHTHMESWPGPRASEVAQAVRTDCRRGGGQ